MKVCIIISAKSIKLHLYWAMKNCGNDPEVLQALIDNILNHYMVSSIKSTFILLYTVYFMCAKGDHEDCAHNSPCHTPAYTPSKTPLRSRAAAWALLERLRDTYVYKLAESFCRVCHYKKPIVMLYTL